MLQLNGTGSMEDGSDVQFVKNRMFAGLRSEFRDDMRQLRDEPDEISNTSSTHLVSCCIVSRVLDQLQGDIVVTVSWIWR